MATLSWGQGPKRYEAAGLDQGVLYLDGGAVPWNGLVSLDEQDTGEVNTEHYFDGRRLVVSSYEGDFEAQLSAYSYPEEFAEYDGFSEFTKNKRFGLSYRTMYGDSPRIHVIYNVAVKPTTRTWTTESDQPDPSLFAWDLRASAVPILGARPTAHIEIVADVSPETTARVENMLYGTETTDPYLPDPNDLIGLYESYASLRITYNSDGTWTAEGPEEYIQMNADGSYTISAPSAYILDDGRFQVSSM